MLAMLVSSATTSAPGASRLSSSRRTGRHRSFQPSRRRKSRSEEHTSELQSQSNLVCRLLLEKKNRSQEFRGVGAGGRLLDVLDDHVVLESVVEAGVCVLTPAALEPHLVVRLVMQLPIRQDPH